MEKSREYECFQAGSLPFPHVISTNFFLYTANSIIVFFLESPNSKTRPFWAWERRITSPWPEDRTQVQPVLSVVSRPLLHRPPSLPRHG